MTTVLSSAATAVRGSGPRVWVDGRPTVLRAAVHRAVAVLACLTVALAPLDEYVRALHPQAAKVPAILLVGAWLLGIALDRRLPRLHAVHVVLGLLLATVLASTCYHLSSPYAMEYLIRWVPFLLVAAVLVDVCATDLKPTAILWSAAAGASTAAAGAVYSVLVEGDRRATGPLEDPNDLAYVLIAALPLLAALVSEQAAAALRLRRSGPLLVLAVLLLLATAATFSRGGLVGAVVVLVWLVARRAIRPGALASLIGVLALGAGAALVVAMPLLTEALDEKKFVAGDNIDSRLLRWQSAGRILAENPLFGSGPGGVRSGYVAGSHLAEIAEQTPVTHNMYLEVGADLGIVGLALFIGTIVLAFVSAERARHAGADARTVTAVQASLLAIAAMSYFLSEEYYMSLWSMIAVACALGFRVTAEKGGERARPASR
ncbi:O-antigen ligase family protein [Tsukamurella sp. 8F]|uniref:O-antigen ligase family protein n=1 Tax=unclassified Tsukamurella TaxID=2633480 RepID=UPI0023B93E47|nr:MULTISPECIES: O-antigen ligase family protein [unclassified Tsukamurella]MDF0530677.1 O-antigen ligase family protein [Tsukamurella sp. 8J]MDF0587878.1 O-antigen ligase family protein [Tsukamurella sp. 8F]